MKQEARDIAIQAAANAPAATWALITGLTLAEWLAIGIAVLQGLYLLRKWWREETEWGLRMKRWANRKTTGPMELDDEVTR